MSRLKTSLLIIVALLTVTILFVVLALPSLVRSKAAEAVKKNYDRTLVIRKLSVTPFTWTVEARGISLSEKGRALKEKCGCIPMQLFEKIGYLAEDALALKSQLDALLQHLNSVSSINSSELLPQD